LILEVQDIHTYYKESYVLQGVTLHLPKGMTIALLGRNGAGKTTLIRSIIGFTPPSVGKITFKGFDITHLVSEQIAALGIGLVPQGRRIFPSLTVRENLTVAARDPNKAGWTLDQIFELFPRLKERLHHSGGNLSGGEQQMLSISRALMMNPDVLLMDEPTEGLAPLVVAHLAEVLQGLKKKGLSILLVEQNLFFALDLGDHIYVICNGKIVHDSSPEEFGQNEDLKNLYLGVS
jgi:branched-chain amino acid transport system ATP-binding protein